jgi:hypothetical protein
MAEQKVESGRIATGAVTGDKIGVGAITGNLIANNAVAGNNIVAGSISNAKLAEPNAFEDFFLMGSL